MAIRRIRTGAWLAAATAALAIIVIAHGPPALAADDDSESDGPVIGRKAELYGIRPEKPVTIKLKRGSRGEYTWEITGDDPEKVSDADMKLRQYIKKNTK